MKRVLFICGLIIPFWSCSNQPTSSIKIEKSDLMPTTDVEMTDCSMAFLFFKNEKNDFGIINEEKVSIILIDIEIGNSGNSPLVIQKADVSCSCVSVDYSQQPIQPGETSVIHAKINPKGQKGYFNKAIFLKTNAKNDVELVRITGQIE